MKAINKTTETKGRIEYCKSQFLDRHPSDLFTVTQKGEYAIKKDFKDAILNMKLNLLERTYVNFAWDTGARINEIVSARKDALEGDLITLTYNKKGRKKKGMKKGEYEVETKTILLSPETTTLIKQYSMTHKAKTIFKNKADYFRKLLKQFHSSLSPKCFRSGKATWMYDNDATEPEIYSHLGQEDNRSLRHYLPRREDKANRFLRSQYEGKDTRLIGKMNIDQLIEGLAKKGLVIVPQ